MEFNIHMVNLANLAFLFFLAGIYSNTSLSITIGIREYFFVKRLL